MQKVWLGGVLVLVAGATYVQVPDLEDGSSTLPERILIGLFELNEDGWVQPHLTAEEFMREQQDRRLGILPDPFGAELRKPAGSNFDITGKVLGALQYHWTAGQK